MSLTSTLLVRLPDSSSTGTGRGDAKQNVSEVNQTNDKQSLRWRPGYDLADALIKGRPERRLASHSRP
jgi:hypothetical protein